MLTFDKTLETNDTDDVQMQRRIDAANIYLGVAEAMLDQNDAAGTP